VKLPKAISQFSHEKPGSWEHLNADDFWREPEFSNFMDDGVFHDFWGDRKRVADRIVFQV